MKLIELNALKDIFLEMLDEAKYTLLNAGINEVDSIDYRSKMFTESGIYMESMKGNAHDFITPGLFVIDGGAILNNPSYDCYIQEVAFEFLAFEKQRDTFRKLLEMYAGYIRGKTIVVYYDETTGKFHYNDGYTDGVKYNCIIETELPVLSETIQQSGYDRFQAYINMTITVLVDIELSDTTQLKIDDEVMPVSAMKITRSKTTKILNVRSNESAGYAENQALSITFNGVLKGSSAVCDKIKKGILDSKYMNEAFVIEYDSRIYKMYMAGGEINSAVSSPLTYTVSMSTLREV